MAAILDLKVKDISKCKTNVRNGLLVIKLAKTDYLHIIVGQVVQKLIFRYMGEGGHLGFWPENLFLQWMRTGGHINCSKVP